MKQSKRKLSGVSNFAKKKALTQISSYYYYSSTPSNLKDSSKGRGGGGGGLLFAFFFALFMETRYFEETDNSYHDFFSTFLQTKSGKLYYDVLCAIRKRNSKLNKTEMFKWERGQFSLKVFPSLNETVMM